MDIEINLFIFLKTSLFFHQSPVKCVNSTNRVAYPKSEQPITNHNPENLKFYAPIIERTLIGQNLAGIYNTEKKERVKQEIKSFQIRYSD